MSIDRTSLPNGIDARFATLHKAHALQSAIFNSANFSSIATDAHGVIQIFNVGAERMLGYLADEVVDISTPADISDPVEIVARATALSLELGTPITPGFEALVFKASRGIEDIYELTYIRKDGSRLPAVVSVTALRDAEDTIIGYLLIGTDNTARQQEELLAQTADLVERTRVLEQTATALAESEERTDYALRAAGMGVWEINVATRKFVWTNAMLRIFGLTAASPPRDEAGFLALIHEDDREMVRDALATSMADGTDFAAEFRTERHARAAGAADGGVRERWISLRARIVTDDAGARTRLVGVGTDISERKSLETQFRQSQKMEAVGQLAGGIAHDFNNLLTAILGYSNFVIEALSPTDPRHSDMEQVILAGQRASALTKQLLAFSRKQVLQPKIVDINELVDGIRPMLARLIGENVELASNLAPDLHTVRADPGQLEQVLMNLVVNARDAMPTGGSLTVTTSNVELDATFAHDFVPVAGPYVMLAVSDSGTGMSDETRRRLFEPFFTTKETGKGTGLGLATVYGIVSQSGGYVWVYSEVGKGSTFKVYLPRNDGADAQEKPAARAPAPRRGTENVLVVEDDGAVRILMRTILERAGYKVYDASTPLLGAALFEHEIEHINMLVTDVIMPGSSGPKLYWRLAQKKPELRVLYVSGYTDDMVVHQGELDPAVELLQKPFTAEALSRRVREVLDRG